MLAPLHVKLFANLLTPCKHQGWQLLYRAFGDWLHRWFL